MNITNESSACMSLGVVFDPISNNDQLLRDKEGKVSRRTKMRPSNDLKVNQQYRKYLENIHASRTTRPAPSLMVQIQRARERYAVSMSWNFDVARRGLLPLLYNKCLYTPCLRSMRSNKRVKVSYST